MRVEVLILRWILLQLCLLAKNLKPALPFMEVDITDISKEVLLAITFPRSVLFCQRRITSRKTFSNMYRFDTCVCQKIYQSVDIRNNVIKLRQRKKSHNGYIVYYVFYANKSYTIYCILRYMLKLLSCKRWNCFKIIYAVNINIVTLIQSFSVFLLSGWTLWC